MSVEQIKIAVQRYLEDVWSDNDESAIDEIIAEEFVFRLPFLALEGVSDFKRLITANHTAFQDLTYRLDDLIADGNKAAACWTMSGKHVGEWQNIPASDRDFSMEGMTFFTFNEQQRISEAYVQNDVQGLLRQISA